MALPIRRSSVDARGHCLCTASFAVTGNAFESITNVVTAWGTDDESNIVLPDDSAEVSC